MIVKRLSGIVNRFLESLLSLLVLGLFHLHPFWMKQGLKFGIYTDRGYWTCAGRPGSAEFEEVDAKTFVQWEVDYVKTDASLGKHRGKDEERMKRSLEICDVSPHADVSKGSMAGIGAGSIMKLGISSTLGMGQAIGKENQV